MTPGSRLGPYEILGSLGAGGMGEVYRAADTNLKRQVAIKVLPASVATDADRLARFQREAEVLAALNHPNIAHIFGVEKSGGTFALAMELVEGPTLADRIARGAVPLDEAIPVARQIADALESAHEQGIIHRDLKPANIKLRDDGTVKVLDFGLAKALDPDPRLENAGSRQAVAVTSPAVTAAGIILGTAAYMAPEQAKGRSVDARADIWAFGCVLFEMLAGRAPFAGESVVDILSTVIQRDPDWAALPEHTPAALRRLLRRCLEKDPKHRLAAIADARLDLDEAARPPSPDDVRALAATPRRSTAMLAVGGALVLMTAVTSWGWWRASRVEAPAAAKGTYVAATLGVGIPNLATLTDRFAVSPDGTMLVIVDRDYGGLALRHMSALELSPIAGAPPNANAPVFSPDGKWIAFRTDAGLMKIPTQGGTPAQIAEGNDYFINLTWGADDRIRYPSLRNDAIRSVSANGGPVDTISFGPRAYVSRAEGLPNGRLLVSMMTGSENRSPCASRMARCANCSRAGTPDSRRQGICCSRVRRARPGPSPPRRSMWRRPASPARSRCCRATFQCAMPRRRPRVRPGTCFILPARHARTVESSSWTARGQNVTSGCRKAPGSGRPRHPTVFAWRSAAGKALDEPSGR